MTLGNYELVSELNRDFACGFGDISGSPLAGGSNKYNPDQDAVVTTNGAGAHNVQMFIMAPDGTVLHCLPGYWDPKDMLTELQLARDLDAVWESNLPLAEKQKRFTQMHLQHIESHSEDMIARSQLQHFDRGQAISALAKLTGESASTPDWTANKDASLTTDYLLHRELASQPFVNVRDFNLATLVDFGNSWYDKAVPSQVALRASRR